MLQFLSGLRNTKYIPKKLYGTHDWLLNWGYSNRFSTLADTKLSDMQLFIQMAA